VQEYGVTCCHHTCGNLALKEYMQGVLPSGTSSSSDGASKGPRSSSSRQRSYSSYGSAANNETRPAGFGSDGSPSQQPSDPSSSEVSGFVMEAVETEGSQPSSSSAPALAVGLVLMVIFAFWLGFRGRR